MEMISIKEKNITFDLINGLVIIGSSKFQLNAVWNEKILDAIDKKQIIVNTHKINKQKIPLYYCARKIETAVGNNGEKYFLDILLYKDYKDTFALNYLNRSLGHNNDKCEKEIHQVLNGSILEIIIYKNLFYTKIVRKDEYIEIPPGAFHCTYILEANTVVANIYSNIFWEKDISLKPYFNVINDISILEKNDVFYFCRGINKIRIDKQQNFIKEIGFNHYDELQTTLFFFKNYDLKYDIFKLLKIIKNEEAK